MPWIYQQATGNLFLGTIFIGTGYAGHGSGLNNPEAQNQHNVGPIPAGTYTIGPPHSPPNHLGPLALPLYPDGSNEMFGRFGFFVHGDNQLENHSASDGCIVLGPEIRRQIASSGETTLVVVPRPGAQQRIISGSLMASLQEQTFLDRPLRDHLLSLANDTDDFLLRMTSPVNAYPELPTLQFQRTSVTMDEVVAALNASSQAVEIKRASYVIFRNESGNGAKGINNNYCGAQADSGRWPEALISSFAGTVTLRENGTNRLRIFLAFKTLQGNLEFLMNRVLTRGLYVGGQTHLLLSMRVENEDDLARAYHKDWVTGSAISEPSAQEKLSFLSMYRDGMGLIS